MEKSYISEISYEQLKSDTHGFEPRDFMYWVLQHTDWDFVTSVMADYIPVFEMINELKDRADIQVTIRSCHD